MWINKNKNKYLAPGDYTDDTTMLSWHISNYLFSYSNIIHLIHEKSNVKEEFLLNWVSSTVFPYFHVYLKSRLRIHGNLVMGLVKTYPLRFMIGPSQSNSKTEFASKRETNPMVYKDEGE